MKGIMDEIEKQQQELTSVQKAKELEMDVVLIDTAGRLHTKTNLMQELEGVVNTVSKHVPGAPHECILVVDGATGARWLAAFKPLLDDPITLIV